MVRKIRRNIDIIIQYDSRERDLEYLKTIKVDLRRNKDGVKLLSMERVCVKPLGTTVSTSDISYKWKFEDEEEYYQSNFACEIKKGTDLMSSVYMKANRDRLFKEILRAKEAKLDFYFLITDNMTELNRKINKIRKFNDNSCKIIFDNFMKLNQYLSESGFRECICTGNDIGWVIRRLIKNNIKSTKINYK